MDSNVIGGYGLDKYVFIIYKISGNGFVNCYVLKLWYCICFVLLCVDKRFWYLFFGLCSL